MYSEDYTFLLKYHERENLQWQYSPSNQWIPVGKGSHHKVVEEIGFCQIIFFLDTAQREIARFNMYVYTTTKLHITLQTLLYFS